MIKNALIEKDGYVDIQYLQSITSGLTIHVNNQFFNINTFFMFLTSTIFIALIYNVSALLEKSYKLKKTAEK